LKFRREKVILKKVEIDRIKERGLMKFFNTAGPVNKTKHYKVDPLQRWDLEEILSLIENEKYFILHAPRQTGKTSSLLALQEYLNQEGKFLCLYVNVEVGQAARNNIASAITAIISVLQSQSSEIVDGFSLGHIGDYVKKHGEDAALGIALQELCEFIQKPLVLLVDEIDSLVGNTLISVLRQLRAFYIKRPKSFPSTVVLCGVRDIKDYRIQVDGQDIITGGSAFNIKSKSLRLGNFSEEDVRNLLEQHTAETGQIFEEDCYSLMMNDTDGQPWLVNALAHEVTYEMKENRDRNISITKEMLQIAKERLIQSRQTHLDQLADKLKEDRVRRVVLPMILGEELNYSTDDDLYCIDLGLIKNTSSGLKIANDIYKEIIPRELNHIQQRNFLSRFSEPLWISQDGSIHTHTLFTMFKDFWNDNAGIWGSNIEGYQEAAPQLITQAFLQRVANGKGSIHREYGIAKKRTDLMLQWNYMVHGERKFQKIVLELKVVHKLLKYDPLKQKALEQTAIYAKISGSTEAHLFMFDRDDSQGWKADETNEILEYQGIKIEIWKFNKGW